MNCRRHRVQHGELTHEFAYRPVLLKFIFTETGWRAFLVSGDEPNSTYIRHSLNTDTKLPRPTTWAKFRGIVTSAFREWKTCFW